ncbi:MAG: DUF3365 domain-containing protein [Desulfobacteraceae bacterium]|nr:DUF3365 domain-containing protein [Desulfobacteraceae bacterium]
MTKKKVFIVAILWAAGIAILCLWAIKNEKVHAEKYLLLQARSFFQSIVSIRAWNASHGGVYVPVTYNTLPNPYLNDSFRDVTTKRGMKLTKINPAYMTRQIGQIMTKKKMAWFHITSTNPIRPKNFPDIWEAKALKSFSSRADEFSQLIEIEGAKPNFRYMAPLWVTDSCLKCHSDQGYKEGDLRGGISVTISADSQLKLLKNVYLKIIIAYTCIWATGIIGIYFGRQRLLKEASKRHEVIAELQSSLSQIKTLSGLLPICSHCKKIRDDKGYWNQIKAYIQKHPQSQLGHGICHECAQKHNSAFLKDKDSPHPDTRDL